MHRFSHVHLACLSVGLLACFDVRTPEPESPGKPALAADGGSPREPPVPDSMRAGHRGARTGAAGSPAPAPTDAGVVPMQPPPVEPGAAPEACDDDAGTCDDTQTQPVLDIGTMCSSTCALLQDGTVKCWGLNYADEYPRTGKPPARVPGLRDVTNLSAGCTTNCALLRDGTVRCWGSANLGDGSFDSSATAVVVSELSEVTALEGGDGHHCALRRDGSMHCWGYQGSGQLGDGNSASGLVPATVSGLRDVTRIDLGFGMSYAWTAERGLFAWGDESVPLGIEPLGAQGGQAVPAPASLLGDVSQLALGYVHRCLMRPDASVLCWGYNDEGQLGRGSKDTLPPPLHQSPEPVEGLQDVKQIVAGFAHTCAIVGDGAVRCWGANAHGQLGDGTRESQPLPTPVVGLSDVRRLALGMDHSCALRGDHTVVCWGSNEDKRLGADREGDSLTPVAVPGL